MPSAALMPAQTFLLLATSGPLAGREVELAGDRAGLLWRDPLTTVWHEYIVRAGDFGCELVWVGPWAGRAGERRKAGNH